MTGLGTDIIEIARIAHAIQRDSFVQHTFTVCEQGWLNAKGRNKAESAAGTVLRQGSGSKSLGNRLSERTQSEGY